MKRIILLLLIVCSSFTAIKYFSWAGIASNQAVTFANALDAVNTGVFANKLTITSSSKCMTKSEASTYLFLDETYGPFAGKSSGQLVVKSDLVAGLPYASFQCVIANGKGIKCDMSTDRGGLLCTGTGTGCLTAFDFCITSCVVDDNGVPVTYNYGASYGSGYNTVRCYFRSKVTTAMTVTVNVYLNGVSIGSNTLTTAYITGSFYSIDVAVSNIDLSTNPAVLKLAYS